MSPSDWGVKCPYEFLGAYRLEDDNSWTPIFDLNKPFEDKIIIETLSEPILEIKDLSKNI